MIKYYCDDCGKELEKEKIYLINTEVSNHDKLTEEFVHAQLIRLELCETCYKKTNLPKIIPIVEKKYDDSAVGIRV